MNVRDSEFDQLLAEWLEDEAFVSPVSPVEAAVDFARSHPRQHDWLAFLRRDAMTTRTATGLRPAAILVAVLAVLVAAVGGAVLIGTTPDATPTPTADDTPTPIASASATLGAAQPLPGTAGEPNNSVPLAPGRYTGGLVAPGEPPVGDAETNVDVEFTVGDGWSVSQPMGGGTCCWYINGARRSISYWPVTHVYADACGTNTPEGPIWEGSPIGPTVDDLIIALDQQKHTQMSEPIDVTIGGYPGKYFVMTRARRLADYCTNLINVELSLSLWPDIGGDRGRGIVINGGPGEDTQPVYVIDVDGNRVVFVAWSTGTSPSDTDAIAAVMDSMTFSVR